MNILNSISQRKRYHLSFFSWELAQVYLMSNDKQGFSPHDHLDAAAQWICQAQDATPDDGVARSYSLIYQPYYKQRGWFPSYPETTGYIIPTMFDYARLTQRQDFHDRAIRMAIWETAVQMDNGAVMGGTVDNKPTPAIFNTGQVIFGWLRAYQETGDKRFMDSAVKAGKFLVVNQDDDGSWSKNLSDFASSNMPFYTYNTRSAWALYLLGIDSHQRIFIDSALKNIDFALNQQNDNGWFQNNCLNNPEQPILHTIAYCIRGVLETGILSENKRYINSAKKAADALLENIRDDGSLAGRFDADWNSTVTWSCLTGDLQLSIIFGRLYQTLKDEKYLRAMKKINSYVIKKQIICPTNRNIHGGICGSYPVHGEYGKYEILNWAVKFFMDSLMLEKKTLEADSTKI